MGTPGAGAAAMSAPPWVVALWYLAGAVTLWAFGHTVMYGSDLWWHLAAGDLMVKEGVFLNTDPWSYTFQGKPWLNDAWLSDWIYHWWVTAFGLQSLVWWKWGVLIATYLLLLRTLHRVTGDLLSAYLGAVLAIWVGEAFLDIRPQLYSLLGFSVFLSMTLGRERLSWWVPLLFFVWVQLHAIFVFGLIALAVILAPRVLWGSNEERKKSILLGAACLLACLINPHFITVFSRPIHFALTGSAYHRIGEWLPPFEPGAIFSPVFPYVIGLFLAGCVVVLVRFASGKKQLMPLVGLALGGLTLVMSLRSRRFVPLFGIAQSILLASVLAPWVSSAFVALKANARNFCVWATPIIALGAGLRLLWPHPLGSSAFHDLVSEGAFPVDTVNFIEQNHISGNVFAYYNWGGYLHFRTQGGMKVYIDGRADTVFDENMYLDYLAVLTLRPGWLQTIEDSGAEYALWPKHDQFGAPILDGLLQTGRWRLLYEDSVSQLLERTTK